ncbi:hypothetical protein BpHYR1_032471 [Brachionus plicatilis]|uniref:Uncharacterized protein n=1 Tax=Brachionus plicatilis TaxID=10195 RepID=A0A3M7TB01_BRAPC|nr:hypothetical protein BpHYR1_032471 [Brachionus plicatilis]
MLELYKSQDKKSYQVKNKSNLDFNLIKIIILTCNNDHVTMATASMLRHTLAVAELHFRKCEIFYSNA